MGMLPISGGEQPGPTWNAPEPVEGPESRKVWTVRDVAGWLKRNNPANLTLSEAWKMGDQLCKGPLADVWLDGARRGCTFGPSGCTLGNDHVE